jgi:DNA modification methylase
MTRNSIAARRRAAPASTSSATANADEPVLLALSNQLAVEQIFLDRLVLPERLLRDHSERQLVKLAAGLQEFGFLVPILIDEQMKVIAGHARVVAARRIGMPAVPAIRISHLSPAQIRAFRIADNRLSELAFWNEEALSIELKELSDLDLDFDLEVTGFESAEIDLRIEGLEGGQEVDPDGEFSPPASQDVVSRLGDLWRLGDHLLLCGDALNAESYARVMDGQKAQMIFIDPPYNIPIAGHVSGLGRVQHREFVMASGEMTEPEFTKFLEKALRNLADNLTKGGLLYACMDFRHHYELGTAYRAADLDLHNICVWVKSNAGMGSMYRSQHELVFVLKSGTTPHVNNVQLGRFGRWRSNCWSYPGVNTWRRGRMDELALHPTVKPMPLVADAIRDCTRRQDVVLDSFAGSGTTILAVERTGRIARALELDPAYVDACVLRWEKFTGRKAIHAQRGIAFGEVADLRRQAATSQHLPGEISAGGLGGGSTAAGLPAAPSPTTAGSEIGLRRRCGRGPALLACRAGALR